MRAALQVHGVEVALQATSGPLESLVLHRYWGHLGLVREPVVAVSLHPAEGDEVVVGPVDLRGGRALVDASLPPTPEVLDGVVLSVVTPLLVRAGALLVRCDAVFDGDGVHLLFDDVRRAVVGGDPPAPEQRVVVHRRLGRWKVATTPFGPVGAGWPDRRASLRAVYVLDEDPADALRRALALEYPSPLCDESARALAAECARAVPCHDTARESGRRRIEELLGPRAPSNG